MLTGENAIPHLYHFCTTLRSEALTETQPTFSYEKNTEGLIRSTVFLPGAIDRSLRILQGRHWWMTKQAARQDAAFQAMRALYRQKLINDHLLPLFLDNPCVPEIDAKEILSLLPPARNVVDFWKGIPGNWMEKTLYKCRISFAENGNDRPELAMALFTPVKLPVDGEVNLYWDDQTTFTARLQPLNIETAISPSSRYLIRKTTTLLFQSTRARPVQELFPEFLPFLTPDLPLQELKDWLNLNQGTITISKGQTKIPILAPPGLVRGPSLHFPHIFVRWIRGSNATELFIECRRFGRRKNLLQRASLSHKAIYGSDSSKTARVAATECVLDCLPWELSLASLAISPVIQLLHQHLMAKELQMQIFKDLPGIDFSYLQEAITAPSSQWPINYQRLEFLGDSILKFIVATHAFLKHPLWHEGYLSKFKDLLVSNERLTRAAVSAHLEKFICVDFITPKHFMFSPHMNQMQNKGIPRKVFADVIEALAAAAYECGGIPLSQKLIGIFLPEIRDFSTAPPLTPKNDHMFAAHLDQKLDLLLTYKFHTRALIWEALTHPSWQRDSTTGSYQRLEFLGDAVLDFFVSKTLYAQCPKLTEGRMTELRAALVNADFLAFLCMELTLAEPCWHRPSSTPCASEKTTQSKSTSLWMFMRHNSPDLLKTQASCSERHKSLADKIKGSLTNDVAYPWATLAQLGPPKHYSDLIESTLGAIFIDSGGCLDACERFLERISLLAYLERFVERKVHLEHPKNALYRLLGTQTPDIDIGVGSDGLYDVFVRLEGEKIASIRSCLTRNEAVVRGADAAVAFLSQS